MIIQDKLDSTFKDSFLAFSCLHSFKNQLHRKTFNYSEIEKDMDNAQKILDFMKKSNIEFGIVSYPAGFITLKDGSSIGRVLKTEQLCLESQLNDETLENFFRRKEYSELDMYFRVQCVLPRTEIFVENSKDYLLMLRYSKVGEPKE